MRDYQDIFAKIQAPLGVYTRYWAIMITAITTFGKGSSPAKVKNLQDMINSYPSNNGLGFVDERTPTLKS
jgi:hypothetical protein